MFSATKIGKMKVSPNFFCGNMGWVLMCLSDRGKCKHLIIKLECVFDKFWYLQYNKVS